MKNQPSQPYLTDPNPKTVELLELRNCDIVRLDHRRVNITVLFDSRGHLKSQPYFSISNLLTKATKFLTSINLFCRFHILRRFVGDFGRRVFDLRSAGEAPRPEAASADQQLRNRGDLGESAHYASSQG